MAVIDGMAASRRSDAMVQSQLSGLHAVIVPIAPRSAKDVRRTVSVLVSIAAIVRQGRTAGIARRVGNMMVRRATSRGRTVVDAPVLIGALIGLRAPRAARSVRSARLAARGAMPGLVEIARAVIARASSSPVATVR